MKSSPRPVIFTCMRIGDGGSCVPGINVCCVPSYESARTFSSARGSRPFVHGELITRVPIIVVCERLVMPPDCCGMPFTSTCVDAAVVHMAVCSFNPLSMSKTKLDDASADPIVRHSALYVVPAVLYGV